MNRIGFEKDCGMFNELSIQIYHGEAGTLYQIVKTRSEQDWGVVKTCHSMEEARKPLGEEA